MEIVVDMKAHQERTDTMQFEKDTEPTPYEP